MRSLAFLVRSRLVVACFGLLAPLPAQEPRPDESLVDYLASTGQKATWEARKALWAEHFRDEASYRGSLTQNMRLLEHLLVQREEARMPEACRVPRAATASREGDGIQIARLDITDGAKEDGEFFVVFSARRGDLFPTSPGHAWVSFGIQEVEGGRCVARTFGNFPLPNGKRVVGRVPGRLVEGWRPNSNDQESHRLIVKVTSTQYVRARRVLIEWSRRREYEIPDRDCARFALAVAGALGLRTSDELFPASVIARLIRDNVPPVDGR
jgi:hypothetical protein